MDICIDFDGTCVTHEFPDIGADIGAVPVLKRLCNEGHNLILSTMRSNVYENTGFSEEVPEIHNGSFLDNAVAWFKAYDIPLYGINANPAQHTWTKSPKAYAQLYIDDAGIGCPLIFDSDICKRPFVDWDEVEIILEDMGVLKRTKH